AARRQPPPRRGRPGCSVGASGGVSPIVVRAGGRNRYKPEAPARGSPTPRWRFGLVGRSSPNRVAQVRAPESFTTVKNRGAQGEGFAPPGQGSVCPGEGPRPTRSRTRVLVITDRRQTVNGGGAARRPGP